VIFYSYVSLPEGNVCVQDVYDQHGSDTLLDFLPGIALRDQWRCTVLISPSIVYGRAYFDVERLWMDRIVWRSSTNGFPIAMFDDGNLCWFTYIGKSSIKLVDFNCHIWLPHCKSNHIPVSSRYFPYYIILHLLPHIPNHSKLLFSGTSIWVNHNISLTWIVRPFGDDSPKINHGSRLRENSEVAVRSL